MWLTTRGPSTVDIALMAVLPQALLQFTRRAYWLIRVPSTNAQRLMTRLPFQLVSGLIPQFRKMLVWGEHTQERNRWACCGV